MSSILSSSTPGQSQRPGDKALQFATRAAFFITGAAMSVSAAGKQRVMPAGLAVASVSTLGYTGILTGLALPGFIAQWSSLSLALGCVALLLLVVSLSIRLLTRSSGA
ncbi:Membrane protein mosC [Dickeya dadantii 3937]|uniref:Membrane protein mosC n=1 Tax=Dickeya dadantii (strain 3937) TaxID=198628 RepID=E0SDZ5_DICD3|nr:Membrane protein mosC [Dickeya dadantii 3937]